MIVGRFIGGGLVHHSDRGVQYVSIKYTERVAEAGIKPSVGSVGDSYDNALAETINELYKAELIWRKGPWRSFEAVEFATLEWVDWFNNRRLLEPIGNIPPAEAEARYYAQLEEARHRSIEFRRNGLRRSRRGSVFRLSARAIEVVVEPLRRTVPRLVTTKRISRPSLVASMRATARRSLSPDLALCRVSA